jgi:HSP20 family molecular chaperone IbpA
VLPTFLKDDPRDQGQLDMKSTNGHMDAVLTEPHQKHIPGQSDVESMLHSLVDRLREPIIAHKPDKVHFLSGPWHQRHHKQHIFVPHVDMRETKHDYYIDIELPGVYDKNSINIEWTANRKLLIEGASERPSLCDTFGLSHEWDYRERGDGQNGDESDHDEIDVWENGGHIPVAAKQSGEIPDESFGFEKADDLFPTTLVDGSLIDEGDARIFKIQTHHTVPKDEIMGSKVHNVNSSNPDRAASLNIAERDVGRYMRLFIFPANVYGGGLRAKLEHGLLKIMVPKTREVLDESWKMTVE